MKFSRDRYPLPGEICTFTDLRDAKVAALLFDKIYVPTRMEPTNDPVDSIDIPEEITFGVQEFDHQTVEFLAESFVQIIMQNIDSKDDLGGDIINTSRMLSNLSTEERVSNATAFLRSSMAEEYKKHGFDIVPIFSSFDQFRTNYPEGRFLAYEAALKNLPLVSPVNLSWKQVIDFREDKDATNKYRSLRLWLRDGVKANSLNQATDIIAKRIEDYQWAIKKHDLNTVVGVFSKIVSLQSVSAIATGAGMTAIAGGPFWSAIVAGAIISAEVGLGLFERQIDKLSIIRDDYSDIAILHEAKQLLEKSK